MIWVSYIGVCLCKGGIFINFIIYYSQVDSNKPCTSAKPKIKQELGCSAFSHLHLKYRSETKRGLEKPLPMPFELPQNYPAIVMAGLNQCRLCGKARPKFIASIASAIFKYKNYPTSEEYHHIGAQIIKQYPFLKSSSGSGYVSNCHFSFSLQTRYNALLYLDLNL